MDEAGLHSHQIRGRGWAKKAEPAAVTVPKKKGVNICIVGCISPFGTINFSKLKAIGYRKNRKIIPKACIQEEKSKVW
jgi:hypothetical protein